MTPAEFFIIIFVVIMMLAGMVGIFLPYFPGVLLIWSGIFLYSMIDGFSRIDQSFILFVSLLTIVAMALDYVEKMIYARGMKKKTCFGAVLGAVVGTVIGSFLGDFYPLMIGGFFGAVLGEVLSGRDAIFVIETDRYRILSFFGATLVKITLSSVMILLFLEKIFLKSLFHI